jgi:hypothetical protein
MIGALERGLAYLSWCNSGRFCHIDVGQVDADVLHYALKPLEDTPLVVLRVNLGVMAHTLHRGRHRGFYPA